MANLNLTRVLMGLTNYNHDHYMRNHSMNIQATHLDALVASRLGATDMTTPGAVESVAKKTCGISASTLGLAPVQDGWAVSRGLIFMEFDISNGGQRTGVIGLYGYLYGGDEIVPGYPVPENIMISPVRVWTADVQTVQNMYGTLDENVRMRTGSQFLSEVNGIQQDLIAARPYDLAAGAMCSALDQQQHNVEDEWLSGGSTDTPYTDNGVSVSSLKVQPALTNIKDNSPVVFGEQMLNAALGTIRNVNSGGAIATGLAQQMSGSNGIAVPISLTDNLLVRTIEHALGRINNGATTGWAIGEIAHVFDNFHVVSNATLTDLNNNVIADNRLASANHDGATYGHAITNDVLQMCTSLMSSDQGRLSYLEFEMDNNIINGGQVVVNGLPVGYQFGESLPMMTDSGDWVYSVEWVLQQLAHQLYPRFNSEYVHERMLVRIRASIALFGESTITVICNGDPNSEVTLTFSTCCGNRFDPMLSNESGFRQQIGMFSKNIKDALGEY